MGSALRLDPRFLEGERKRLREAAQSRTFDRYRDDPVGFFENVFKVWSPEKKRLVPMKVWDRQRALLELIRDHDRVGARAGQKVSKSNTGAGCALWYPATRPGARVFATAPTFHQVKRIIWREIGLLADPVTRVLGGEVPRDPATGIQFSNGSEIIGLSTAKPENLAGLSSPGGILFIIDEASGFPDELFHVIRGNSAGGAKILAISNPTLRPDCTWYPEIFRSPVWRTLRISSEDSPNVKAKRVVIPGLATWEWIQEMREEYGPDYNNHPQYKIRVLGEFAVAGDETIFRLDDVIDAQERWRADRDCHGPLCIGVDPAWTGTDACGFAVVRGDHTHELTELAGRIEDPDAIARPALELAERYRTHRDRMVTIVVDGVGEGARVVDSCKRLAAARGARVAVVDHRGGDRAHDEDVYANRRSEVWYETERWLRHGGDLPPGDQIRSELLSAMLTHDPQGRQAVESKQRTKRRGAGSPNLADALTLAVTAVGVADDDIEYIADDSESRGSANWM